MRKETIQDLKTRCAATDQYNKEPFSKDTTTVWHWPRLVFPFRQKRLFMLFLLILGNLWSSVVIPNISRVNKKNLRKKKLI